MAGYYADSVEYLERDRHRSPMPEFGYGDSQVVLDRSLSTIAPAYGLERDYMRERDTRTSLSIVRPSIPHHHAPTIINEPVIEHEHHHLHHHIDHG